MSTHSAEVPQQLASTAAPSLMCRELVELARTNTPTATFNLARELDFPVRQAKAAKALAVIRRDFGETVFEAYLETTEQLQKGQARENRGRKMDAKTARTLARITDPGARLRFMFKHGLTDQIEQQIVEMTNTLSHALRYRSEKGGEIFDDVLASHASQSSETAVPSTRYTSVAMVFWAKDSKPGENAIAIVNLEGMRLYLGWDEEKMKDYIRPVLEAAINPGPDVTGHVYNVIAVQETVRQIFGGEDPFRMRAEVWLTRSELLRVEELHSLRDRFLAASGQSRPKQWRHDLDPVVDFFLANGMTMDEVKADFSAATKNAVRGGYWPYFKIVLAGAKCFDWKDRENGELAVWLREHLRPNLWKEVVSDDPYHHGVNWLDMYCQMCDCGMGTGPHGDVDNLYRNNMVALLSEGKLTKVWQLAVILGPKTMFYVNASYDPKDCIKGAKEYMQSLIAPAFAQAFSKSRYGVAAALVQQFGKDACFSEEWAKEQATVAFAAEFTAIETKFAKTIEEWHSGELDDDDPKAVRWHKEQSAVCKKRDAFIAQKNADLRGQIEDAETMADEFNQPIGFTDLFAYYQVPDWGNGERA